MQLIALEASEVLIVHDIAPNGVKPALPVTITLSVVVPPRVAELAVIALIVGSLREIVVVKVLDVALV